MIRTALITFFLCIAISSYGQKQQVLPILKTMNDTLDVRYNDYLIEKSWVLSSKKKIDVLPVEIDDQPLKVTFFSTIDSISFIVNLSDRYDFVISRGTKKYTVRIEGRQALITKKDDSLSLANLQCLKTNARSPDERMKQYPFNKAKRVELISFIDTDSDYVSELPVKNKQLDHSKIREQKVLDTAGINELTDIWYNVGKTPIPNLKYITLTGVKCYEPKNAIIFFNDNDQVFEYVEICFHCKRNRYSSNRIKPWDDCEQKYDILRNYFANKSVKFGTEEP